MTDIVTEAEFLQSVRSLMSDLRPVATGLSENELALVKLTLRSQNTPWRKAVLALDLTKLPMDRLFQVVVSLQQVKPTKWNVLRQLVGWPTFSAEQCNVLLGIAWRLSDLIVAKHPALGSVLETGWESRA
jgi:hypothetical protein